MSSTVRAIDENRSLNEREKGTENDNVSKLNGTDPKDGVMIWDNWTKACT